MGFKSSVHSNEYICVADVVPGAPTITGVTVSSARVSIAFTAGANSGSSITNYQYRVDGGSSWVSAGTTTSPIIVTGLTNGQTYNFSIRAVNTLGAGSGSNSVSKLVDVVPGAPTITIITTSNSQAEITYTAGVNYGSPITDYKYSTNNGATWVSAGIATNPITVVGLINETLYNFQVKAVNAAGVGAPSNTVRSAVKTNMIKSFVGTDRFDGLGVGSATEVNITGYSVAGGFQYNSLIRSIIMSNSVIQHDYAGFADTPNLETIRFSNSAISFNRSTVSNSKLKYIFIDSINGIGFPVPANNVGMPGGGNGVVGFTTLRPSGVSTIGKNVYFVGETGETLTQDIVNAGLGSATEVATFGYSYIGPNAFNGKSQIKSLNIISNSVKSIDPSAFENSGLSKVIISSTNDLGITSPFPFVSFFGATTVKTYTVISYPEPFITSVTTSNQTATISFTQPILSGTNAITMYEYSIDSGANWFSAGTVTTSPITVTGLTNGTIYFFVLRNFNGNYSIDSNTVNSQVKTTVLTTFVGTGTLTAATVTAGIRSATEVNILGYTNIDVQAFSNYINLTSITLPIGLLTISGNAFSYCSSLVSLTIPNSVKTIGSQAFNNCSSLTTVTIGSGVTSIGPQAFNNCSILTTVIFIGNIPSIDSNNFTPNSNDTAYYNAGATNVSNLTQDMFTYVRTMTAAQQPPVITGVTAFNQTATINFTQSITGGLNPITRFEYSINGGINWYSTTTITTPITVTGLTKGSIYFFVLKNYNGLYSTPSNSFSALIDVVPGAPTITGVTVSSAQAVIAFTEGTNGGSQISGYQYSKDSGSNWVSVGTTSPITVPSLINGINYVFQVRAMNIIGASTPSNSFSRLVRPTLPEAKTQNTSKSTYTTYGYQLQDLVNSGLFTLIELKQIGYVLSELKAFFTTDTLIRTWLFTGSELKQEGLIESGITFIYLVIVFNGVFSVNRTYALNNTNKEDTYYNVVFEGQYFPTVLSSISI